MAFIFAFLLARTMPPPKPCLGIVMLSTCNEPREMGLRKMQSQIDKISFVERAFNLQFARFGSLSYYWSPYR